MRNFIIMCLVLSVSLVADWESDIGTIKTNDVNYRNNVLTPMLEDYYYGILYGVSFNSGASGGESGNPEWWSSNYDSFWPEIRGENHPRYVDNEQNYLAYAVSLGGLPTNWGDYPITKYSGENILHFDVFSDTINRSLDKMDTDENGYGINSIQNTETFQRVQSVLNKVDGDFHDAMSNVNQNLFVLNFAPIGEFFVAVTGNRVSNPFADFQYGVSLIPDEEYNPLLFKIYTYWPLKENSSWRNVFKVLLYLYSFVFMLNKIKEILGGEWT